MHQKYGSADSWRTRPLSTNASRFIAFAARASLHYCPLLEMPHDGAETWEAWHEQNYGCCHNFTHPPCSQESALGTLGLFLENLNMRKTTAERTSREADLRLASWADPERSGGSNQHNQKSRLGGGLGSHCEPERPQLNCFLNRISFFFFFFNQHWEKLGKKIFLSGFGLFSKMEDEIWSSKNCIWFWFPTAPSMSVTLIWLKNKKSQSWRILLFTLLKIRGGWFGQYESNLAHPWRHFTTTTTEASSSRGGSWRRFHKAVDYPALRSTPRWGQRIQITFFCMRAAQHSHPLKAWPHQLSSRQNIPEAYFCAAAAGGLLIDIQV